MLKKILSITILCMILTTHGFAAEKIDFSYRGIELGESYEEMVNKIGQPRMDISHLTDTAVVTYYIYGENNDTRIGIDEATKKLWISESVTKRMKVRKVSKSALPCTS